MGRHPDLDEGALTPVQARVFERIASGPRGHVAGPLRVWLQSPDLADRAQALGQFVRYDSALPPLLSELAILVTARMWSSGFEWAHHAPLAIEAGLSKEAVEAIAWARRPLLEEAPARAVFDFVVELHRDRRVGDAAFEAAHATLGTPGCVDLVGLCGYYGLISMTINVFDVPTGKGPTLPSLDMAPQDLFRA